MGKRLINYAYFCIDLECESTIFCLDCLIVKLILNFCKFFFKTNVI